MPPARLDLRRLVRTVRSRAKECYVNACIQRPVAIHTESPTFSFTFDDAPVSAYATGAKILEQYGARGTFFLCGKFLECDTEGFINRTQALELCTRGHSVGVHTYGHLGASDASPTEYRHDVARGVDIISTMIGPAYSHTFSYPYGQISPAAGAAISDLIDVARTTFPGVNARYVNRLLVRGNRLYSSSFSEEHMAKLVRLGAQPYSWTVFYTHDVSDVPSRYGVTPAQLKQTIEQCLKIGGRIVTFAEPLAPR